jgi:hypothetical protein
MKTIIMNIKNCVAILLVTISMLSQTHAQAPPSSGSGMAASRGEAVQVNNFTGVPSIGIPLYSYSSANGLSINVGLNYFAGGVKVNDAPSPAGLNWNIEAGGIITRTVRGLPDDYTAGGFMYNPVLPADARGKTKRIVNKLEDTEMDVFQFNFAGRSGKFFIGKDSQCYMIPMSKMKISFTKDSVPAIADDLVAIDSLYHDYYGLLKSFTITTEDGTSYLFNEKESQDTYIPQYNIYGNITIYKSLSYGTAWYLTKIYNSFSRDSIKISYTNTPNLPSEYTQQSVNITNANVVTHSDTSSYLSGKTLVSIINKVPKEILLPDNKKVVLYYSQQGQYRYSSYPLLQRVKIMDSSTLKYGYMLNWDTTVMGGKSRDFLTGLRYYNNDVVKTAYQFNYYAPYFNAMNISDSVYINNFLNKKDHWGYYNGAANSKDYVPSVAGFYTGANRTPNANAIASTLASIKDPSGGTTYYDFENNDMYPIDYSKQTVSINAAANTSNFITLNRTLGTQITFKVSYDLANSVAGTIPIAGAGAMVINLTDASGNINYSSTSINLRELYTTGSSSFTLTIPTQSGSYLLKTNLVAGTTIGFGGNFPISINWINQTTAATGNATTIGGIRIKQVRHYEPFSNKMDTLSTYKYVLANGKSSGFLGATPIYDYYFNTTTGTDHKIVSNVINDQDYAQGSSIGYSRVEVIKGTPSSNLGKQVFEYSNFSDVDFDNAPTEFPFVLKVKKDWAWGLPKKVQVYDNAGRLIQSTKNIFNYVSHSMAGNDNYCSLKLGQAASTTAATDTLNMFRNYKAEKYYPQSGRIELTASLDTFYHPDLSITTSKKELYYDTNYNVVKTVSPYDINKNLSVEKRIYYPYNYTIPSTTDYGLAFLRDRNIFAPIATETWITGDATPRMLGANITQFANVGGGGKFGTVSGILKPVKNYVLQTNKPLPQATIGVFNPALLLRDTSYLIAQQASDYDARGNVIQTTSLINGVNNSTIYGYNNTRAIAKISNAKYTEVAYTSFEPNSYGGWQIPANVLMDSTNSITGKYSYELGQAPVVKYNVDPTLIYYLTFWAKGYALSYEGFAPIIIDQRNGWTLYSQKVAGYTTISVQGYGLIDELRMYPINANMETITYNDNGEVQSSCDANSNITYNEYDLLSRPLVLRDKDKNILKKYDYSEGYTPIDLTPKWIAKDNSFWKCERSTTQYDTAYFLEWGKKVYYHTGNVLRAEVDTNNISESYNAIRYVYDHRDTLLCNYMLIGPPPPPPPSVCDVNNITLRLISNVCEVGTKVVTSSIYRRVAGVWMWQCTYHYVWSDGFISPNYILNSSTSTCVVGVVPN